MKILITGREGSGKSTQAEVIAQKFGLCLVNAGQLIRKFAQGETGAALKVRGNIDRGEFVDDLIVAKLVKEHLNHPRCAKGLVMDGYPRRLSQLRAYDPGYDIVFNLFIPQKLAYERLIKRGREDDTPEVIHRRLKRYLKHTRPVLKHYQSLGKLVTINGGLSLEKVTAQIERYINERQK